MQKKKSPPIKNSLANKKGQKKDKKLSERKVAILSLLIFLVFMILGIQVYSAPISGSEHLLEYSGGCFLRSYSDGTGINASQIYELIPSELNTNSLPAVIISPAQYETLGGDSALPFSSHICKKNISLSYSIERHKIEKLEVQ